MTRKQTPREWIAVERILNLKVPLKIDAQINDARRKKLLQPFWLQLPGNRAVFFGRCALIEAIKAACSKEREPSPQVHKYIANYSRSAKLAKKAQKALDALLTREELSWNGGYKDMRKGWNLWLKSMGEICGQMVQLNKEAVKNLRGPRGEVVKRAFVYPLAEGWVHLTGKLPGSSKDDHGPFFPFIQEAWLDAGQQDETSFTNAVAAAVREIKEDPVRVPLERVQYLARYGPIWWLELLKRIPQPQPRTP
jgi:hypothetical protein